MTIHPVLRLALVAFISSLFTFSLARPTLLQRDGTPFDPTEDPFYQPPDGFESEEPGPILRQRSVNAAFFGLIPNPVEAYQLLYRTTAIDGSPIATVTTVFKPDGAKEDRFVAFHTAYDSSSPTCNPSYNYQLGATPTDLIASIETLIIEAYLLQGYIVTSSDYEGPDAAFSPGHLEGMCALDSMRAVINFRDTISLSSDPMIVGTGYSGGAIATGWAASLQPTYAPELNMKGWVQGGTPANLTATLLYIDDTLFSGFLPAAVAGLIAPSAYGAELAPVMERIITDKGKEALEFAQTHCAAEDLLNFPDQSILTTEFQTLGDELLQDPTISSVLAENIMGVKEEETPTAPVFIYHSKQDEIIPYADASTLVDSWCSSGASVKYTTLATGGHLTAEIVGLVDAVKFVQAAFAGETDPGCSENTELGSIFNPIALGVELEPILIALLEAFLSIGKNDENLKQDISLVQMPVASDS